MEDKVYIVTTVFSGFLHNGGEEYNIEKVFSDEKNAQLYAKSLQKEYETMYTIVPEEVFENWPMDDICHSPIPKFEGYSYDDYQAQLERCHDFRDDFISCSVEEFPVHRTTILFNK